MSHSVRTAGDRTGDDGQPAPRGIYGRESEQGQLRDRLAATVGRSQVVLIDGEAGVGKTTLVMALAAEAQAAACRVLMTRCYDQGSCPPFDPWLHMLRAARSPGAKAEHEPAHLSTNSAHAFDLAPLSDLVFDFFASAAADQTVFLVFEDAHWADQGSLDLLRIVARQLTDLPVLIVITCREMAPVGMRHLERTMANLVREARAVRLSLQPLPDTAVRRLVRDQFALAPADETSLVAYLRRYCEGNPFFVEEMLRMLQHQGRLAMGSTGWVLVDLVEPAVPPLIRHLIEDRAARLEPHERQLLQVAAVIGVEVQVELWQAVLGSPLEELAGAVEQAVRAQVMEESADRRRLRFTHALVREALYEGLPLPRRMAWHGQVARVLAARPDPEPDAVAYHLERGGDAAAIIWLRRAGERAARADATRDAADRFERALALMERFGADPLERATLLRDLAEAWRYTDPQKALGYIDQGVEIARDVGDEALGVALQWSRARVRGFLGENALSELAAAVARLGALMNDPVERSRLDRSGNAIGPGMLAQWLALHGRYAEAIELAEPLVMRDGWQAMVEQVAAAEYGLGLAYAGTGRPDAARTALTRAHELSRSAGNAMSAAAALKWTLFEVILPYAADDRAQRSRLVDTYAQLWARTNSYAAYDNGAPLLPLFPELILAGEWATARTSAEAYLGVDLLRADALSALATLARLQGRPEDAWRYIREALPEGPAMEPEHLYFLTTLPLLREAAELALDAKDFEQARRWILAHDRWLESSGRLLDRPAGLLLWSRLKRMAGDPVRARELTVNAIDLATRPRQPLALLMAHRAAGRLFAESGQREEGARHLERALAIADACAAPYERSLILHVLAEFRLGPGRVTAARGAEAAAIWSRLEVARGLPPVYPPPRSAGGASPDQWQLTTREVEVLRLVEAGRTNAQIASALFITTGTARIHVSNILSKLGARTRTEAAAIARQHDLI